jgi:hypothetical protein
VLSRLFARLAVLADAAAVLVDVPQGRLRFAALAGGVELGLLVWQTESKDGVWHGETSVERNKSRGFAKWQWVADFRAATHCPHRQGGQLP